MDVCSPSTATTSRALEARRRLDVPAGVSIPRSAASPATPNASSGCIETLGEAFCRKLGIFRVPDDLVLSVVIPAYNEKGSIHEILRRVRAVPIRKEIVVVDDCSTDGTREILREMEQRDGDLKVVFHERNQGKGAALRTGFRARDRPDHHRPGRRPRVRPGPVSPAHPADRRGPGRRRLRLAVHRRDPPRPLLLALPGQQVPHAPVQHVHQPEPDRHGGLLQGLPPRGHPGDPAQERPLRLRAGGHGQGGPVHLPGPRRPARAQAAGSTRSRCRTTGGPTAKGRRSGSRTASRPCTASCAMPSPIDGRCSPPMMHLAHPAD